jgi:hypothetical protein
MGPAPTLPVDPRGRILRPPPAPAGASSPLMDARWDPRSADSPSGVLRSRRRYAQLAPDAARPAGGHTRGPVLVRPNGARQVACSVQLNRG